MRKDKKLKAIFFFLLFFSLLSRANFVWALDWETEITYPFLPFTDVEPPQVFMEKISSGEPGYTAEKALPLYVKYFYYLFLMLSGTVAFFSVLYAGVRYLLSVGHATKMAIARSQIEAGVLGLLVLFCSYLILSIINPQLAVFHLTKQGYTPPGSHKECIGKECVRVPGTGEDRCDDDSQCVSEEKVKYVEIPMGWLIDRVKAKSQVARDQAQDVWYVGAERGDFNHTSVQELALCLDILKDACSCSHPTEGCPSSPDQGQCPLDQAWCREPCDQCINPSICISVEPLNPEFINICPADPLLVPPLPEGYPAGESLKACPGQCNLRAVLDAKTEEFSAKTQQLLEEQADAQRAKKALEIEKQKLEIAEALLSISHAHYAALSFYEFWAHKEEQGAEKEIVKLEGFEHVAAVQVSTTLEENPDLITPSHSCRTADLPGYEITPSCAPCPCDPDKDDLCDYAGEFSILFCYGNRHRGPADSCPTIIPAGCVQSEPEVWWCGPGLFPSGLVYYNGGVFSVPAGGVIICDTPAHHCSDARCKQASGALGVGIPARIEDDEANFYLKEKENKFYINLAISLLAMIQGEAVGPGPDPGDPWAGERCPADVFPSYVSQWEGTKERALEDTGHYSAIMEASAQTGVRPALIMALVSRESGFDQFAGKQGAFPCDMCSGITDTECGYVEECCPLMDCEYYKENNCRKFEYWWNEFVGPGRTHYGYSIGRMPLSSKIPEQDPAGPQCGGAMGLSQAMVFTWETIWGHLWTQKDPWDIRDAYMFTAIKLQREGGADSQNCVDEIDSVQRYFGVRPDTLQPAQCIVQLANHIAREMGDDWAECVGAGWNPPPAPPEPPADAVVLELPYYYCQDDKTSDWWDILLGGKDPMNVNGCNLTSFAMILQYLGSNYDPGDIARFVNDQGLWQVGPGGGLIGGIDRLAREFRSEEDLSYSFTNIGSGDVAGQISNGNPVFTGCANFHDHGQHWIVIRGVGTDTIYIGDPYCSWGFGEGSYGRYYQLSKEQFEEFGCGEHGGKPYYSFW